MKRYFILAALCFASSAFSFCWDDCGNTYAKFSGGLTFPLRPHICAPENVWDPAVQGYNSYLGTRANVGGAIGYEFSQGGSVEVNLTYRGQFKYKKFQTPLSGATTIGMTPAKTRRFNLDSLTLMGGLFFDGRCMDQFNWNCSCGTLYPIIGLGLGASRILLFDFRSTGLPPTDGNAPLLAFSAENPYTVRWKFAYQISAGLEYRIGDLWAFAVNYRWFDAGHLKGPRYFRDKNGESFDVGADAWRMSFKANELVFDVKTFF